MIHAAGSRHPWHLNPPHPAGAAPRRRHRPKPAAQHAECVENRWLPAWRWIPEA